MTHLSNDQPRALEYEIQNQSQDVMSF
jgi:hypothetical protein